MGREPRYSYSTNGYLGAKGYFGTDAVKNESEVKHPADVFLFSEENLWSIPGLSGYTLNDNGLYIDPPPGIRDCFATTIVSRAETEIRVQPIWYLSMGTLV